mmetsp:Transcript_48093/g.75104  ORF Transcript_48093/g.75104 Transcript_48093/m.75104 type:complete len:135 (+) Transcript_48093:1027-1431(+)
MGPSSRNEHTRSYPEMDIMLDCWPFSGGITTIEALCMGVPVITLCKPGPESVTAWNQGAGILKLIGLEELVATTEDEFVRIAKDLAEDVERLRRIRSTLRERMLVTICNPVPKSFCADMESAYRKMWQRLLDQT